MRRVLGFGLALVILSGCGALPQAAETPQQVVSTAADKMSQVKSAKFEMTMTSLEQFPPSFVQSLGPQGAALANLSIDMRASGQARFPDQESMSMQVKTGSITVNTEAIFTSGKVYMKDPQTGSFAEVPGGNAMLQFSNQMDPLSEAGILKSAQSIKDLGDTSIDGVGVHHYQIVPDKNKLADQAKTQQAKDLMRSMLQSGTVVLEVWIGKDDHLLHRLKDDTDASIDLNQAMQASGQSMPPGFSLPPGSNVHVVVHATIDFHDFNAPVTVTAPPVSPS